MTQQVLGVLELENAPLKFRGNLAGDGTFPFPVRRMTVKGASTATVVESANDTVRTEFVRCARLLEQQGVSAITSNCGFTSIFQQDIAAAVSVPVAMSSLLLVPLVARLIPPQSKVGIVTFNAGRLEERHFEGAGWKSSETAVSIVGLEGTQTYDELSSMQPAVTVEMMERDVTHAVHGLLQREPHIGALVLECAAFPPVASALRKSTGLFTVDVTTLVNLLMLGAAWPDKGYVRCKMP